MFATLLADCFAFTMAELGLDGKPSAPARPAPAPVVVVSSERGGPVTMERKGRPDGILIEEYRYAVFQKDNVFLTYPEITVTALAA